MNWLIFRLRCALIMSRSAEITFIDAWKYSAGFREWYDAELAEGARLDPKDMVDEELSYWEQAQ